MLRSPVSTKPATVLSGSQRRHWFLHQHAEETAYARTLLIEHAGRPDVERLRHALKELAAAHEELRCSYALDGRNPVRRVHAAGSAEPVLRVSEIQESELAAALERIGDTRQDLAAAPSFAPHLFVLGERSVLALRVHAISLDRWSDAVFLRALAAAYEGPELPTQAVDDRLARAAAASEATAAATPPAESATYWRGRLGGVRAPAELPTDSVRTFAPSCRCERSSMALGDAEAAELAAFATKHTVSAFEVHLAALSIVLQRWTGDSEQLIGHVVPGRAAGQALTIGCFENLIPLRIDVPAGSVPVRDFIATVSRLYAQDRAHSACPFEQIVQQVEPIRRGARSPLFDVVSYRQQEIEPLASRQGRFALGPFTLLEGPRAAHVDLSFVVQDQDLGWQVHGDYDASLFRDKTVAVVLSAYRAVLLQLIRNDIDVRAVQVPADLTAHAEQVASARIPVQIAGDLTLDPLLDTLRFWSGLTDLRTQLHAPSYGQLFQELVSDSGALAGNTRGFNIVVLRYEQWCAAGAAGLDVQRSLAAARQFVEALAHLAARNPAPQIVIFAQPARAWEDRAGFEELRRGVDRLVDEALPSAPNIHVVRPDDISARYPVARIHEEQGVEFGDMPYSEAYYRALATVAFRRAFGLFRKPAKVIVLDCDYTLWDGACSEVAVDQLVISEEAANFQRVLQHKRREGALLCLCSQNDEVDVWRVFEQHPRMVLRKEDITLAKIDWNSKSSKIAAIAEALNLSLDSFVFMDDDALQCAEVRARLPEVVTVQVSIPKLPGILDHLWVLDARPGARSPVERAAYYRDEARRGSARSMAASYAEYLEQLNLKFTFHGLADPAQIDRVSELSYRTNQFNATAVRRSSAEIRAAVQRGESDGLVLQLQDDFGDYGIVGAVLFGAAGDALEVTDLFLSCRALNRGAEYRILQRVAQVAEAAGLSRLRLHFRRTEKNALVRSFLMRVLGADDLPEVGVGVVSTQQALALRADVAEAPRSAAQGVGLAPRSRSETTWHGAAAVHDHIAHKLQSIAQLSAALTGAKRGWSHRSSGEAFKPPRTEQEAKLVAIWSEVLGMKPAEISVQDRFMDLGGQSLLGMRMLSRVRQEMHIDLSVREFAQGPTIRELADVVRRKSLASRAEARVDQLTRSGRILERGEL